MSESTNTQQNDVQKSNEIQQPNANSSNTTCLPNKPKLFKIKEGELLHYKRKLFTRNWRPVQVTLYSNGSFLISSRRNSTKPALIKCEKNSTLIIFGQHIDSIPKRPSPPSGDKLEHMLAIGLITCNGYTNAGKLKGTQIVFYWFSMTSQEDLINWVVAFQNSIYSNFSSTKPNPDIQTVANNIALNNAACIGNLNNNLAKNTTNLNDGLALGLLMANTSAFPDSLNLGGVATVGAAGLFAANAQYQALVDSQRLGSNSIFLNAMTGGEAGRSSANRIGNSFLDTSGYVQDDSTVHMIPGDNFAGNFDTGPNTFSSDVNNLATNMQFAEMATILNAADYINCSVDCSLGDCSVGDCSIGGVDAGADCGGDFAFAFAI